ncbi:serine hydrolase domain-containing protein [Caulobacter mirabilis]|nr:serine hydrolase domain-containing protein [Caulobacter mirabilis]
MWGVIGLFAAGLTTLALAGGAVLYWRLNHCPDRGDLAKAIDEEAARWLRRDATTDVVVAVVKGDESRITSYGPTGATGATVFQIGSVSKVFTGLLLQRFVDAGALRMDQTLGELIGARFPLAPTMAPVTLLQLSSHASGLPTVPKPIEDEVLDRVGRANLMHDPYNQLTRDEVLAYLADPVGKRKPGRFSYSNYGMGLLAHVLELVTGKSYAALLEELIFAPLGMRDSYGDLPDEAAARLIQGHDVAGQPAAPWRFSALGGAGSIASSAHDLVRFIEAGFDGASPLYGSLVRQRDGQPHGRSAIGWLLPSVFDRLEGNRSILWHNGAVNGYFAYLAIDPVQRAGVVVLVNRQKDITALGAGLVRLARTQSWRAPTGAETEM